MLERSSAPPAVVPVGDTRKSRFPVSRSLRSVTSPVSLDLHLNRPSHIDANLHFQQRQLCRLKKRIENHSGFACPLFSSSCLSSATSSDCFSFTTSSTSLNASCCWNSLILIPSFLAYLYKVFWPWSTA